MKLDWIESSNRSHIANRNTAQKKNKKDIVAITKTTQVIQTHFVISQKGSTHGQRYTHHPTQTPLLKESYNAQQGSQALKKKVQGKKSEKKKRNPATSTPTQHAFVPISNFHFRFITLPTHNPTMDHLQGRVIVKPVTSAQIRSSQVRHDMLVCEARQILMEGGSCALQCCRVLGCWRGAA